MKIEISLPDYDAYTGINLQWVHGAVIKTRIEDSELLLTANKEGLLSLAYHLIALAQDNVPIHKHIHYDDSNSLEAGSASIIIERM